MSVDWLRDIGRLFQPDSSRRRIERELDDEIGFHLERTASDLHHEGLPEDAARREARRRFGDLDHHRARLRAIDRRRQRMERRGEWLRTLWHHVNYAWRGHRRSPGFTLTVVATLALGIGVNATMFGIVDRILLRPPDHVVEAERVRRLYVERRFLERMSTTASIAYPDFQDFVGAETLSGVAAYTYGQDTTLGSGDDATRVRSVKVSGGFFDLLGARPALGRVIGPEDDRNGAEPVVVLGHGVWRDRFGADPDIVGSTLEVAGEPMTVAGVAPEGFTGVGLERVGLWAPLHGPLSAPTEQWENERGWYWLHTVARLAPGVSETAAEEELTARHRVGRADESRYDPEARVVTASLIAARGPDPSGESRVAVWLVGVSALVLLVACANVANLLLARGIRRRAEIGVRLALGVSRGRLVVQLLVETLLLALMAGAAAFLLSRWGGGLLRRQLFPDVDWSGATVEPRLLLFTFVVAAACGCLGGLVPALQSTRQDLRAMFDAGRGSSGGRSRTRSGLMVLQGALSVILLVGAGLFVRSLQEVRSLDMGFEPEGLMVVTPDLESAAMSDDEAARLFVEARERLARLEGVRSASFTAGTSPFTRSIATGIALPGREERPRFPTGGPYLAAVPPGYFDTMGIDVVRGRAFAEADRAGDGRVVVVNETLARTYWPGEDALGECLKIGGSEAPCSSVVGVVEDARRESLLPEEPTGLYYVPFREGVLGVPVALFARLEEGADEDALASALRQEAMAAAPELLWVDVQPLRTWIDPQARSWELGASMFTLFGVLALAVAAIGLYGVLAFEVARRRREIGVRAAMGAGPGDLVRLVLRRSLSLVLLGAGLGVAVAVGAAGWIEPLLYGVGPRDPAVYVGVVAILTAVATLASLVPAWRASGIDPARALRRE